jgi:hypothetical protein
MKAVATGDDGDLNGNPVPKLLAQRQLLRSTAHMGMFEVKVRFTGSCPGLGRIQGLSPFP